MQEKHILSLANHLLQVWGLSTWNVQFDNAYTRAGCCHYNKRIISLSRNLITLCDAKQVQDVILHEIAHAITGPGHAHNQKWKHWAKRVGANPQACLRNAPRPSPKWLGRCPAGHEITRYRRSRKPLSCAVCAPYFDKRFLITWYLLRPETSAS